MKNIMIFVLTLLLVSVTCFAQEEYIVSLKPGTKLVPRKLAGKIKEKLPIINGYVVVMSDEDIVQLWAEDSVSLNYTERNKTVSLSRTTQSPTYLWNLARIDERIWSNDDIYQYDFTGAGVDIYVVDTGLFKQDPEFTGRVVKGYGQAPKIGCNTHGHSVAAVAGGETHGVAKDVILIDVHVYPCQSVASVSDVIKGLDWIHRTIQRSTRNSIVNMSLGTENTRSLALEQATQELYNDGALPVIAAGNWGVDACTTSPSHVTDALVVSGFMEGEIAWGFNSSPVCQNCGFNWGPCVDIYAPGYAGGRWIDSNGLFQDGGFAGTSFAAPHGSGTAALYWQAHPTATNQEVHDAIIANGTPDVLFGVQPNTPNLVIYSLWD